MLHWLPGHQHYLTFGRHIWSLFSIKCIREKKVKTFKQTQETARYLQKKTPCCLNTHWVIWLGGIWALFIAFELFYNTLDCQRFHKYFLSKEHASSHEGSLSLHHPPQASAASILNPFCITFYVHVIIRILLWTNYDISLGSLLIHELNETFDMCTFYTCLRVMARHGVKHFPPAIPTCLHSHPCIHLLITMTEHAKSGTMLKCMHDTETSKCGLALKLLTKNYKIIIIQDNWQASCKKGTGKGRYYCMLRGR